MSTPRSAPRPDRTVGGDGGFTLAETLVSASLLVLVAGGATTGIVAGIRAQDGNADRTAATNLVRADLDAARAVQDPDYPDPSAAAPVKVGTTTFTLSRSVTAPGSSGTATCPATITSTGVLSLTITSTATWGTSGRVAMSTVISC